MSAWGNSWKAGTWGVSWGGVVQTTLRFLVRLKSRIEQRITMMSRL